MNRTTVRHRVPFYETDAMGIVHHANYVRYLEIARVAWMDEHDRPYKAYVADGYHFSTTRVEFDYKRTAAFDDIVEITTWLEWVGGASLAMAYELKRGDDLIGVGSTEHALVDLDHGALRLAREAHRHGALVDRNHRAHHRGRGMQLGGDPLDIDDVLVGRPHREIALETPLEHAWHEVLAGEAARALSLIHI